MYKYIFILFFPITLFLSCEKDDANGNSNNNDDDSFDRQGLLINWSDFIIIPAYNAFENSLLDLEVSINNFIANPNISELDNVSMQWLEAYRIWQHVEMFDIGYAESINYKGKINIYPTNSDSINVYIADGNNDLNNNKYFDTRGFPAMDYMLHGLADNKSNILDFYVNNSNYSEYLSAIINSMIYFTQEVVSDWSDYRDIFINLTDNTTTSSINKMTNDFIFYFEKGLRANKIGIPAGRFSNGTLPHTVEAFYKQTVSKELALEALTACKNFFSGQAFNSTINGLSLFDYLNHLPASSENELSAEILDEFMDAEIALNGLNDNFIFQIENDNSQMLQVYDAIQKLVVSFKVDMLQSLDIPVDYIDADGD